MKPLARCGFTAFISYAHGDDAAWFGWVTQFKNELERSLRALLRGVKLPPFHLSGENGPVAGRLGSELEARIDESFAMIIVVHDNYAQSEWCLRELECFTALCGEQAVRERLYIVALSEPAIAAVAARPAWQRLLPGGEQLWLPFYEPGDTARPLDVYMAPGLVAPAFRTPFERLRSDFAAKLRLDVAGAPLSPLPETTDASAVAARAAVLPPPAAALLLGFGPAAPAALAALQQHGGGGAGSVDLLPASSVLDDFAAMAGAGRLLLPFDEQPLTMAAMAPGGHLEVQRRAWLGFGKPAASLLWLDMRRNAGGTQGAAAWVAAQPGIEPLTPAALAAHLRPPPGPAPAPGASTSAHGVRIYIESNRHERTLWEPLGEQIRRRWEALCLQLAPGRVPPLVLRTRGLPVEQIDSFPSLDDADGVVLLWGRKTSEALVAQINKVENKMAPGRDAAPGIVAYLMPPQHSSEPVPAWGWQVLRFNAASESSIAVLDEEGDELSRFLKKVFERRAQRDAQAA